ncbi:MAG TPA: hypothetical protein VF179_00970 [Thermoanaerobaculia bacterium]|nr:hypothetical protein [Thermoanaerobaculia bacterium]
MTRRIVLTGWAAAWLLAASASAAPQAPQAATPVAPTRIDGLWEGAILYDPAQFEMETVVEIAYDAQGKLVGTIDIPSQQMKYYSLRDFQVDGTKISFKFYKDSRRRGPNSPFLFEGELSPDGRTMQGMFTGFYHEEMGIDRVPFRLQRVREAGDERPAEPEPPLHSLSARGEELRESFNRDVGGTRLVMLLSPT